MSSNPTQSTNFDANMRRLKAVIERYDRDQQIRLLVDALADIDQWIPQGEYERIKELQPWSLLFILELCFMYGQVGRADIHENTLQELVNTFHDISNFSFSTETDPRLIIIKTLRTVAFQQFYFQNKICTTRIGKEIWLFRHSPEIIKEQFKQITGYSLEYYYINYFFFMMWVMSLADPSENIITWRDWARSVSVNYDQVGDYLFRTVKRRHSPVQSDWALPLEQITPPLIDVVWQPDDILYRSFFFDFPVIRRPEGEREFVVPSKLLLQESLLKRPYRILKANFGQQFSGVFGLDVFEKYLQVGLESTEKCFFTEADLLGAGYEKQVDFVLLEDKALILIEAKAIEMTPYRQIYFSQQNLEEGFKSTVVKGYTQIHYVAGQLKSQFPDMPIYSLIVTYEELFLGHGELIWYEWMEKAWQKRDLNPRFYTQDLAISPNQVFVISADCYDHLMRLRRPISSFLQDAIESAGGATEGWITLDQCLKGEDVDSTLPYHAESMEWLLNMAPNLVAGLEVPGNSLFRGVAEP